MACNLARVGDVELHQHAMTASLHWLLQNPPHTTPSRAARPKLSHYPRASAGDSVSYTHKNAAPSRATWPSPPKGRWRVADHRDSMPLPRQLRREPQACSTDPPSDTASGSVAAIGRPSIAGLGLVRTRRGTGAGAWASAASCDALGRSSTPMLPSAFSPRPRHLLGSELGHRPGGGASRQWCCPESRTAMHVSGGTPSAKSTRAPSNSGWRERTKTRPSGMMASKRSDFPRTGTSSSSITPARCSASVSGRKRHFGSLPALFINRLSSSV